MIPTRDKNGDLNSATLGFEEDWLHIGLTVHLHLLSLRAWRVLKLDTYFSSAKIFVLFDIWFVFGDIFYLDDTPHKLVNLKSLKQGRFAEICLFNSSFLFWTNVIVI